MKELNRLTMELIHINKKINDLYAEKREIEKKMELRYNNLIDLCGETGKTIDDFEEA